MRVKCAGCGKKERFSFGTWWYLFMQSKLADSWLHLRCWSDYLAQREIDGL